MDEYKVVEPFIRATVVVLYSTKPSTYGMVQPKAIQVYALSIVIFSFGWTDALLVPVQRDFSVALIMR